MDPTRKLVLAAALFCAVAQATASSADMPAMTMDPPGVAPASAAMSMDGVPMTLADWAKGARLYPGLGTAHRRIATHSPEAQRWFDQGLRLLWVFNHDESTRSFARALELDPACAMCAWGVAFTIGPNYNLLQLVEPRAKIAYEATGRAQRLAQTARPADRALIAALAHRYPSAQPLDAATTLPVLADYSAAMRAVARRFPSDPDIQTLYAESMMDLHAWKLWNPDGTPADGTLEIVATLERVLKRYPAHVGALHYYVHAVEMSPHPERAVAAAERLRGMAPAAGHLEHMPAHIFQRVGRYEDAAEANRKGAAADVSYMSQTTPLDYYPMYLGHNYQFLAYSAAMEGREAETLDAVRRSRSSLSDAFLKQMPGADWYVAELYSAYLRFGKWDAMLAEQRPDPELPGLTGGWLYGRAVALAATGRSAEAGESLRQLDTLTASLAADAPAGQNALRDVLAVASSVAAARIATAEGRQQDALRALRDAVRLEDGLAYDEPSEWFFPVRHLLGAELLRAGAAHDAEVVYRDELRLQPHDGWALRGLALALAAQGRTAEARAADAQFQHEWRFATLAIGGSAF
jgi:tetratricopeptide (TPR) repeat protein